jgi:DNA-binding XRE family transcriptional regulator
MELDLSFRLDELPDTRRSGSERWCWSCCEWYPVLNMTSETAACERCSQLEGPYILPPMARVQVDTEMLTDLRRKNGWSQAQLGCLWDVTRGTLSNYERGNHYPLAWQLRALARILERPLDKLLADLGASRYRVEAWTKQGWTDI